MKKTNEEIVAWTLLALVVLAVCCAVRACVGLVMYNDWTCGFRQCVIVKEMEAK